MTFEQWSIAAILVVMLIAYASERFRIELVAMVGLAAAWLAGAVPVQNVFSGFASPAVITVVEVLLIVAALSRTRVIESFARKLILSTRNETTILFILCAIAGFVSVFMNNIGALALIFPVALSVCARLDIPITRVLMPLSFATLLGGTCSLTGTPANLVVNQWKISETGGSFGYFELALVGGPVALAGLAYIVLAARRFFPASIHGTPAHRDAGPDDFLAEIRVPPGSRLAGLHLSDAETTCNVRIHDVTRHGAHVFARRADIVLAEDDLVLVEGEPARFEQLSDEGQVAGWDGSGDPVERAEVVVMPDSLLLGSRVGAIEVFAEHGVSVLALASRRRRIEGRFDDLQIGLGDVLVLGGTQEALREAIADCGVLTLSARRPSRTAVKATPAVVFFAMGIALSAFGVLPSQLAFGAVVLAMAAFGSLNLRDALQDLNWPIVVLLGCMIPLGIAVEETGAARILADTIVDHLPTTHAVAVIGTVLLLTVGITLFIDNVSTAAILSPVAAGIASRTGLAVEPLLMAVAVGASLDFLTPFGHHNNAVVMGAAGYRFSDFPRFGAPLLAIVLAVAMAALSWVALAPTLQ